MNVVKCILRIIQISIRNQFKDGESVQYKSLTYEITKVHSLISEEEMENEEKIKPYDDGYVIKIFGFEIFNNVK